MYVLYTELFSMNGICGPPHAHQNTGSSAGSATGKEPHRERRTPPGKEDPTGKGGPHWERRTPPGKKDPTRKGGPRWERRTPPGKEDPTGKGGPHQAVTDHHLHMIPSRPAAMYRPQYGSEIRQQWGAETEVSHCLDKVTSDCALQTHIINEEQWKTCEDPPPKVKPCHVGLGMVAHSYDPSTWMADAERLGIQEQFQSQEGSRRLLLACFLTEKPASQHLCWCCCYSHGTVPVPFPWPLRVLGKMQCQVICTS